jgi:hypothetical protein
LEVRVGAIASAVDVGAVESMVRAEFLEEPALRLTVPQLCRLLGLDLRQAPVVVRTLVARGTLTVDPHGCLCPPQALDV